MQRALLVAVGIGLLLLAFTYIMADPILMAVATPKDTFSAAKTYLLVRVLAQPAGIVCGVAQSGLLAMKDSVSPLWAILSMCIVNCVGDALMVGYFGLGLAGIAWATVLAQYTAAAVLLLTWSRRKESPFAIKRMPTLAGEATLTHWRLL
jgi:Na+-driven multidrug efflux pump